MQMSFDLTEDVVQQLKVMPNSDDFVNQLRRIQVINATPSKSSVLSEAISQNTSQGVL